MAKKYHGISDANALNVKLSFVHWDLSASDISSFLLTSNSVLLFLKEKKWSIQMNRYSFSQSIYWFGLCQDKQDRAAIKQ